VEIGKNGGRFVPRSVMAIVGAAVAADTDVICRLSRVDIGCEEEEFPAVFLLLL